MRFIRVNYLGGGENSELNNYINDVYDYYCMEKIIGLAEDGVGNAGYSDFIVEKIDYTEDDLNIIKNLASSMVDVDVQRLHPLLYDRLVILASFEKYTNEICINKKPSDNIYISLVYIKCRKVNKYSIGFSFPDEVMDSLPEYLSLIDIFAIGLGIEIPLIKITAEEYYKGQYFMNKSKIFN